MLVLSRKLNEEIVIAGDIRVTVLEICGNRVRLGIQAPSSVSVVREELMWKEPQNSNRSFEACVSGAR